MIPIHLASLIAISAFADCTPWFYHRLPRDREYCYAVGSGKDAAEARATAVSALKDNCGGGDLASVAGLEQDDHQNCNGYDYVMVRVEKARVAHYVKAKQHFQNESVDRLGASLNAVRDQQSADSDRITDVNRKIQEVSRMDRGPVTINVSDIEELPLPEYAQQRYHDKLDPMIQASMYRVTTGQFSADDIATVIAGLNTLREKKQLARFCNKILADGYEIDKPHGMRQWVIRQCVKDTL